MVEKHQLTISIVNFNAGDFLVRTLASIEKVKDEVNLEVFVVDNASSDNSIEKARKKFPNVKFIQNDQNLGFGRANNLVLKQIKTEYVLILNPDVEIKRGVLTEMIAFMEKNQDVGLATCKVVFENGKVDLTAHRGFPNPWAGFLYYIFKNDSLYHLTNLDLNTIHEIDSAAGAFMLTRKAVLEKSGFFDEDYFLYAEDIDLCFNIKKSGFKIMYVPTVSITHFKGVSSGLKKHSQSISSATIQTKLKAFNAFYDSMKIFYTKHYQNEYPRVVKWLVFAGIELKRWTARNKLHV